MVVSVGRGTVGSNAAAHAIGFVYTIRQYSWIFATRGRAPWPRDFSPGSRDRRLPAPRNPPRFRQRQRRHQRPPTLRKWSATLPVAGCPPHPGRRRFRCASTPKSSTGSGPGDRATRRASTRCYAPTWRRRVERLAALKAAWDTAFLINSSSFVRRPRLAKLSDVHIHPETRPFFRAGRRGRRSFRLRPVDPVPRPGVRAAHLRYLG